MIHTTKTMTRVALGLSVALGAATLPACEQGPETVGESISFSVQPSHQEVLVGETVTLTSSSQNLLGRDAQIEWNTTGGELKTMNNNRVAQVTFDQPGTYRVNADLTVSGNRHATETLVIKVNPIQTPGASGQSQSGQNQQSESMSQQRQDRQQMNQRMELEREPANQRLNDDNDSVDVEVSD